MTDNRIAASPHTYPERRRLSAVVPGILIMAIAFSAYAMEKSGRMRPWLVKSVVFTGNASIKSSDLRNSIVTKPSSLFHKTKFSQSLLNADIETIVYLYRNKGFLDIQAGAGDVNRDQASHRVSVTILIREGRQTLVDSLIIKGCALFKESEIRRFIHVRPLMPYSTSSLSYDQQNIRDSMAARGYPLCVVDRVDSIDSVAHRAAVVFSIDQGPLVRVGAITVTGAKRLRQVIVKRALTLRKADTLTTGQMQRSVKQLYETGMFKYVQISMPVADSTVLRRKSGMVTLPVVIDIEEADFYKYQGGVGYGTYEGPRLSFQTSYGNVLELGRSIGLDGNYSRLIQGLHLHYTAPWFLSLPPTAEAEVFGEHHDEITFTGNLEGLTLSLFAKTRWKLGYRVFTTFEWINGVVIPPQLSDTTPFIPGNNTQAFGVGFTYDTRDNLFDPTKGLFVNSDAEAAGLIGAQTNHFYKFIMDVREAFQVTSFLDAATAATAGYVNGYGVDKGSVPPQELLYAGSETIRSVRGYAPGGLGGVPGGRLVLVVNAIELRLTIAKWLKIAGFLDAGYVWASASEFSLRDLCWTSGPGLRIRTPVGLLSADVGMRINGATSGVVGFSISIGEPF